MWHFSVRVLLWGSSRSVDAADQMSGVISASCAARNIISKTSVDDRDARNPANASECIFSIISSVHSSRDSLFFVLGYILSTWVLLVIPSKMQVLSIGMYCLVMILIPSWATMPPVNADILCSSPPLARATSSATCTSRRFLEASGMVLSIVARISDELEAGTWEVALRERYIGRRDSGIATIAAVSSFAASDSMAC